MVYTNLPTYIPVPSLPFVFQEDKRKTIAGVAYFHLVGTWGGGGGGGGGG